MNLSTRTTSRCLAVAAAAVCAGVFASSAHADVNFTLIAGQADGDIVSGSSTTATADHIQVVRGGVVIAHDDNNGSVFATLPAIAAGDTVVLYANTTELSRFTWDGTPTVNADACAGTSTFTASRADGSTLGEVGWFTPNSQMSTFGTATDGNPFTVTLPVALSVGDTAYVESLETPGRRHDGRRGPQPSRHRVPAAGRPHADADPGRPGPGAAAH